MPAGDVVGSGSQGTGMRRMNLQDRVEAPNLVIEHFLTLELLGDGITADEPAGVGDGVCVGG